MSYLCKTIHCYKCRVIPLITSGGRRKYGWGWGQHWNRRRYNKIWRISWLASTVVVTNSSMMLAQGFSQHQCPSHHVFMAFLEDLELKWTARTQIRLFRRSPYSNVNWARSSCFVSLIGSGQCSLISSANQLELVYVTTLSIIDSSKESA